MEGHEVSLFASGDSLTGAELISCTPTALRLNPDVRDPIPHYMLMLDRARQLADRFDIIHFHIDQFHFPLFRDLASKTLTTLHGRQDLPDLQLLYKAFPEMPLVSISTAQRAPIPDASFAATIHHGIPAALHHATLEPRGGYLAFLGRIAPEKRVDRAIAIAQKAGLPLKIAAKVDRVDKEYFEHKIRPMLDAPGIDYIGEIDEAAKTEFLGNALALLFPIDWPEPFGMVMIEAFACGTPVLAFSQGGVTEIVEPGVTGEIVNSVNESLPALERALKLNRRRIRKRFDERFTSQRMARDYLAVYSRLLARKDARVRRVPSPSSREVATY
jgi:glycosyltransferase involved in cell wall biosynthesis